MQLIIIKTLHGNTGHVPYNALTAEETKGIVVFLENYAEMHAILLPGRIPGVKDYGKAKLLPSSVSRHMVYKTYADACGGRIACESSFKMVWKKYVPHIYSIKPMTDLCWTCKKNSTALMRIGASGEISSFSEVTTKVLS